MRIRQQYNNDNNLKVCFYYFTAESFYSCDKYNCCVAYAHFYTGQKLLNNFSNPVQLLIKKNRVMKERLHI